jgi:aerobic carbon-monoxide dehydrogenase large subunit
VGATFPSGAHLALVEVDTDTGNVEVLNYIAVDDCGRILNHYLMEAQVHGALAQGISQALYEEIVYDQDGQLISGTLMDYTIPRAEQIPAFITGVVETPSPVNPMGAKGVGEGGCTGGPPAIVNAVLDALSPLGIKAIDMPLRPEKIWQVVQAVRAGTLKQPESALPEFLADEPGGQEENSKTYVFE